VSGQAVCPCAQRPALLALAVAGALGNPAAGDARTFHRPAAPHAQRRGGRRRLWEVPVKHHCVLVGATFNARELRRMFRRRGYADWETASDYELHSSAVCLAKERNGFSVLVQRSLEDRFRSAVSRFATANAAAEVLQLWRTCAEEGEAVAAYWAALTHPECDVEIGEALSREMHMIAHQEFAARRAMQSRLRALEERAAELVAKHAATQEVADMLRKVNAALSEALRTAQGSAREARSEVARWRSGDTACAMRARQAELEAALETSRAETAAAKRALREAQRCSDRLATGRSAEERICWPPGADAPTNLQPKLTPLPDIKGCRVLCIGGKASLVPQYRAIVESACGDFSHHDGGIEHHVGRLSAMLAAADAVICLAADCSHAAYRIAKRYCKVKDKPYAFLGNSSASALARCITEQLRWGTS